MNHERSLLLLGALPLLAGCGLFPLDYGRDDGSTGTPTSPLTETPRELPPLVTAETPPRPISGGTLLVSAYEEIAIVADPDTDRVHRVSLVPNEATHVGTTMLEPGDEPGRVAETESHFFVSLRSGGAVVQLDRELGLVARHAVCAAPRGLDVHDAALYVACLGGDLVTLDAGTGAELDRTFVGADLRDVVTTDDFIYVSHFRSADVSVLSRDGSGDLVRVEIEPTTDRLFRSIEPSIAYRMVEDHGRAVVLHQLAASSDVIPTGPSTTGTAYYGGGAGCAPAIVQAGITILEADEVVNTARLGNLVLPVDVAIDGGSGSLMVAAAGQRTDERSLAPTRAPAVALSTVGAMGPFGSNQIACNPGIAYTDGRRATSVGYTREGRAVILTRAPTEVHVVDTSELVPLPGPDVFDTGHDLFFGDASSGIACASCHAEGGDDGQVWQFATQGSLRTQDLRGGLLGTEPFHWAGDMPDFAHLAAEVFSARMTGPQLPAEQVDALAGYIDTLDYPPHGQHLDPLAVARGRALFESPDTACTTCHAGPRFTMPGSYDVGTGGAFQVPSLLGVGLRPPFIHDGCAEDLAARFRPDCGGDTHGRTYFLSDAEVGDLVAYLESL